jgi:hypothetical protein
MLRLLAGTLCMVPGVSAIALRALARDGVRLGSS